MLVREAGKELLHMHEVDDALLVVLAQHGERGAWSELV